MKKTLAVIAVLILLAAAFAALRQRGSSGTSSSSSSSSSSPDAFANWQPVNGPDRAWSLKLPFAFSLTFKSDDRNSVRFEKEGTTFEFGTESASSLEEYLQALDEERSTGYEGQASVNILKEAKVTVAGQEGSEREIMLNAAGFSAMETYVFSGGKVYRIATLFTGKTALGDEDRLLHRNIVSTVRFGS